MGSLEQHAQYTWFLFVLTFVDLWRHEPERGYDINITQPKVPKSHVMNSTPFIKCTKVMNIKNWNENRVMTLLNIKNWNEYRVVQLKENWTREWKQGNSKPRNLWMKTFSLLSNPDKKVSGLPFD